MDIEKRKQYLKEYEIKNVDKIRLRRKEYRLKNKEKLLEWRRNHELVNKERISKQKRDYQQRTQYHKSPARKAYALNHKDEMYLNSFKHSLRKFYNITIEEYYNMFDRQNGRCAICGIHQNDCYRKFSVDHDHGTKKVRGLLRHDCNLGIGQLKENVDILYNAIFYLENH